MECDCKFIDSPECNSSDDSVIDSPLQEEMLQDHTRMVITLFTYATVFVLIFVRRVSTHFIFVTILVAFCGCEH